MTPFDATLEALAQVLGAKLRLRAVAETGSTNSDLLAASRTDPRPQLLVAQRQTAGRGRHGRSWQSQPGESLTFSMAWPCTGWALSGLSLAVGTCLAEALDPGGQRLQLKWPNDLWLERRKLGGVLIETLSQGGAPHAVVVGIGLNLVAAPLDVPTAGLCELAPGWTAPLALATVVPPLVDLLARWQGFTPQWRSAYGRRDGLLGRKVCVGERCGIADGVSAEGLLQLRNPDGTLHTHQAGDARLQWEAVA